MAKARLTIDLDAIVANWRALDAMTSVETAAVVKADAYGLGAARVGPALAQAGAQSFFVALAEEGVSLRDAIGPGPRIYVFSGLMAGDEDAVRAADLVPLLNSLGQVERARRMAQTDGALLTAGLQLDTGMNRLGLEPEDAARIFDDPDGFLGLDVVLAMSHLACADDPAHPMSAAQRAVFDKATAHPALAGVPRSLAATGGVMLGSGFHYDLTRPGVGLYGGAPYGDALPVARLEAPILQVRDVAPGEAVGYGAAFEVERPRRIATISVGYADGLIRALGAGFRSQAGLAEVASAGRVSMDLITLDVTDAPEAVEGAWVELLGDAHGVDALAAAAGTIGYEILTSLGSRYERVYIGG